MNPTFQSYIYYSISLYCQYFSNLKTLLILMEKKTLMQSFRWSQKNMVAPKFQNPNFSYFHFQKTNNQNIIIVPNTNMGHMALFYLFIFLTSFNFGVLFSILRTIYNIYIFFLVQTWNFNSHIFIYIKLNFKGPIALLVLE